jgi:hypothetical protein
MPTKLAKTQPERLPICIGSVRVILIALFEVYQLPHSQISDDRHTYIQLGHSVRLYAVLHKSPKVSSG